MTDLMVGLLAGSLLGMVVMAFVALAEWERGYRAAGHDHTRR